MDKVLKYKFWILVGLVLPMALAGFFIANGGIKAATEERIKQIESIQAPNPNQPGDPHTKKATELAEKQEKENAQQVRRLDQIQRVWMTWPSLIVDCLERDPVTGEIVYRGEKLREDRVRFQFAREYVKEMDQLWLRLNPVLPSGGPYKSRNIVFAERNALPMHQFPPGRSLTVEEIWDAQEDYWLLSMLVEAINKTNESAQDVTTAAIREIGVIELFGGSGESTVIAGAAAAAGGGDYMSGGGDATGSGGVAATAVNVQFGTGAVGFDFQEEYGSQANATAAGPDGSYMGEGDQFSGAGASAKPLRYIGFDPSNPGSFRKRGFYMSILIQEKKIPDLYINLANLDPPVLAGRWGFANNPYDQDHLLRPAGAIVSGGQFGSDGYSSGGFGGAAGGPGLRRARSQVGASGDTFGGSGNPAIGMVDPRNPMGAQLSPAQMAELQNLRAALQGKELVQLDLTGYVTIFTPDVKPEEPAPAEETPAPEATPPADGAAPAETAPQPVEPVADPSAPAAPTPETPTPATDPAAAPPPASDPAAPPTTETPPAPETPAPETPAASGAPPGT